MSSVTSRIRWRLARAELRGAAVGVVLTVVALVAASELPWDRLTNPGEPVALSNAGSLLTRDGWTLVALAVAALAVGGLVQATIHEWRLRRLVAAPGAGTGEDPRATRAQLLRGLPVVSAAASLASWAIGGASLAVLSALLLHLTANQASELAAVCLVVGAMLAPFRYYRVRRELPGFWALLAVAESGSGAGVRGGRAVLSLRLKLAIGVALPLVGVVLTVAAATAHRRDLASEQAVRERLDDTAQLALRVLESSLREQRIGNVREAALAVITQLDAASSRREVALLARGERLAGRTSFYDPKRVGRALDGGEPLERIPGVQLGAARAEAVDAWLVVAEPIRRASGWSVLFEPRLAWLVVLALGGALALAWMVASDVRAGLEGVRAHLDALEPGVTSPVAGRAGIFGDDEIVEVEAQVVELAARVRRARLRRERRRGELEDLAAQVEKRWRESRAAVEGEVELAMRVRRAAEGLVGMVSNVEQLWSQLERELGRQEQIAVAATGSVSDAIEACDRLASGSADTAARVGRLVAAIRPLLDDVHGVSVTGEVMSGSAAAVEESSRALTQQSRAVVDACASVGASSHAVEAVVATGADSNDRVRVAVGDVGQFVHRIEEGVAMLAQGFRVLEEVADRSALLAVNAAIVAARSGPAGGGFTIVADEMRDLAQRAADGVHESVQVAGALGRDVRGAVLAVETVLARLDQMANGARGVRASVEALATAAGELQGGAARAEAAAGLVSAEAARTRQLVEQVVAVGRKMTMTRATLEAQIEGGGSLELALRNLASELGSGVRATVAQTRESLQAMQRPGEAVERLDRLAREVGQGVQTLEADLRELATMSLRAQDLARSLVEDVGTVLRERVEPS